MGLLPLEFTDCLQDSPYFRDSLHSHEKELERTSQAIKELIKEVKSLLQAAKTLSAAQRRLSQRLIEFKFECIGTNQTDDEIIIASSLKEFGKLIAAIEDEKDRMLERAYEQFIEPLEEFRRKHIGAVKERKKKFEKQTAKFCASQERYLGLSTKKQDTVLQEADATLEMEQRDFIRAGLEYVCLIQEVQERKKFEFVETLLAFMYGWLTFYHQGHEVATDFNPHMLELQSRIQKTRENFNASREDIHALRRKMLEVRNGKPMDPGTLRKMYTRSGYLFLMEKKALGTTWNKYYCHYQKENKIFSMIPYNQTQPKVISNEAFRVKACIKRVSESIDKRFCFDILPEYKPSVAHTFQALSEEDRELWLDAMDGKEPMFVHPPKPSDANQTFLDEAGFNFVQRCFQALEARGLEDQGLYRVVGVASKVTKLLTMGLDRRKSEKLNLDDSLEWESKTITSAVKTFFRNLPEPIMTFRLHSQFIAAAKLDTYEDRVAEVGRLISQLPEPSKRMLELLMRHLEAVAANSAKNMMGVSNLGVCFGPTLLRAEEESVAAIMDIKFGNVVVEILIENWRQVLTGAPPNTSRRTASSPTAADAVNHQLQSSASPLPRQGNSSSLTVLPVSPSSSGVGASPGSGGGVGPSPPRGAGAHSRVISPPQRPPPPYQNPPPPPGGGAAGGSSAVTLAHAVIYNNGPKQAMMSPSKGSSPPTATYATWERPPTRHTVPQPLASAPGGGGGAPEGQGGMSASWYASRQQPVLSRRTTPPTPAQRQLSASAVHASSLQNVSGSSLSPYEDGGGQSSSVEYPPLAPRPKIVPRSSSGSGSAAASSSFLSRRQQFDSSSSSVESLASSTKGGGGGGTPAAASSTSPLAAAAVPQRRPSLTATASAPLQATRDQDVLTANPEISPSSSSSSGGGRQVRTLYACVAEHETELSFEPNQIITNVRPSLEPGWLEGTLDGKFGLVPENYVEFIT